MKNLFPVFLLSFLLGMLSTGHLFGQCNIVSNQDTLRIPQSNLSVYLPFDQNFLDASGNNFHPTNNLVTLSPGICGNAADFSNPNNSTELVLPNQARFQPLTSYSVSLWIKTSQQSRSNLLEQRTGNFDPSLANFTWYLNQTASSPPLNQQISLPAYQGYPTTPYESSLYLQSSKVSDGNWHHYVAIKDISTANPVFLLYEDGCLISSVWVPNPTISFVVNGLLRIGNDRLRSAPYNGLIDEFRIYQQALSEEEVYALYRSCRPLEIEQTQFFCQDGNIDVTVRNPQPNVTYRLVNESGQVFQPQLSGCGQDSLTFSLSNFQGDTLYLEGSQLSCSRTFFRVFPDTIPLEPVSIQDTLCKGDTLFVQGTAITDRGTYTFLDNSNSCSVKTTYHIELEVPTETIVDTTICVGDTLFYQGTALTDSGRYTLQEDPSGFCSDVRTFELSLTNFQNFQRASSICEGDSVVFDGNILKDAGSYTIVKNRGECTETTVYELTVYPKGTVVVDTQLCAGDTLRINNLDITTPGSYIFQEEPTPGCKSNQRYIVTEGTCTTGLLPSQGLGLPQNMHEISSLLNSAEIEYYDLGIFDFSGRLMATFDTKHPFMREEINALLEFQGPVILRIMMKHKGKTYVESRKIIVGR